MLDYILIGLTLLAGFAAVRGDTWDAEKPKVRERLTRTGKVTVVLIIAAGSVSAWKQYVDNKEEATREEAVKSIVNYEIDRSIDSLLSPFRALYRDTNSTGYIPEDSITLSLLLSPENLEKFQSVCLDMRPQTFFSVPDAGVWDDIFESGIKSGVNRLKNLIDIYAQQMDPALLKAVHKFLEAGVFNYYVRDSQGTVVEGSNTVRRCFATPAADTYKSYLEAIRAVSKVNEAVR